jgi:Fuc2NAc and GlcNAc transferase
MNLFSPSFFSFILMTFALFLTWKGIGFFIQIARAKGIVDVPNERSSHTQVTVRGGGVVIVLVWTLCSLLMTEVFPSAKADLLVLLPGALLTAIIGWRDDLKGVRVPVRLACHFLAAGLAMAALGGYDVFSMGEWRLELGLFGSFLALLAIVWSLNLFNFMDGIDGIAGTESVFVFGIGGLVLYLHGATGLALLAWLLTISMVGFLVWNWPKARVFMGDVCSGFLGFLVLVFALIGAKRYNISLVPWVILYGVFWFDAFMTLVRRVRAGGAWYAAHRTHAYQRLHHLAGWSHGRILLGVICINVVLSVLALLSVFRAEWSIYCLVASICIVGGAYIAVERLSPFDGINSGVPIK